MAKGMADLLAIALYWALYLSLDTDPEMTATVAELSAHDQMVSMLHITYAGFQLLCIGSRSP